MKQTEIKDLSVTELQEKLGQSKKAYADLKMAHAISPIENPLQIRGARRTVARLATELTKRELQQL
jgi:large subunit ribosomal protein L29